MDLFETCERCSQPTDDLTACADCKQDVCIDCLDSDTGRCLSCAGQSLVAFDPEDTPLGEPEEVTP